jgi:hypothetical protein
MVVTRKDLEERNQDLERKNQDSEENHDPSIEQEILKQVDELLKEEEEKKPSEKNWRTNGSNGSDNRRNYGPRSSSRKSYNVGRRTNATNPREFDARTVLSLSRVIGCLTSEINMGDAPRTIQTRYRRIVQELSNDLKKETQ